MSDVDEGSALARIERITDASDLRRTMKNAASRSLVVRNAALMRLVDLSTEGSDDPVVQACWRMVHTIEEIRRYDGRRVWKMNRLRPKIERDGAVAALAYCAMNETDGFREVLNYDLPHLTAEALVLAFPDRFEENVLVRARARLVAAGVDACLYDKRDDR